MEKIPYLIFKLSNTLYGINALAVQEIFLLPEVMPIPETPDEIVGIINLRGQLLVIIDLNYRWGSPSSDYHLTDSVIVIECNNFRLGLLVNKVDELQMISSEEISRELSNFSRQIYPHNNSIHQWIIGFAKIADNLVILLELEGFIEQTKSLYKSDFLAEEIQNYSSINSRKNLLFCPNASLEERQVFQDRAKNLLNASESQEFQGLIPLAVIGLNQEYFGILLTTVKEFIEIHNITPIPCTPAHIIGNMNLRGEIVTLIDIRSFLNLSMTPRKNLSKAMIVKVENIVSALVVDEVFDIIYLDSVNIRTTPTTVRSNQNEFLQGTAPYRNRMMSILDLKKFLTQEELVVNDEV
ncbi:chemotaxis protein CheW [Limnoraphis robusta Tam1]|uniref:Chemotaxis protein CheW n=1 Tax=Limnoraphis robusta CCNP1315 TaxID=3110306 RepID=A0ABU5TWR0_9CYAN|nr:chemotaxis protein CheW [Limnoraphis robusta]MEA5497514.1 chemotaxis protein CheW [Limnoraphis robusta BA-68 BA1]MEA5519235.1 chemotaxis protein CheW [Limnoraphis robusta CCNP1315]MEA5539841.1 chemotaxis protein CheW [Limnoraphis robusta Tam1]MEA5543618.1 chemotaxis protein CheW [Limnoraphis robusta CCNP1324]